MQVFMLLIQVQFEVYYPWLNSKLFSNAREDCPKDCSQKEICEESANASQPEEVTTQNLEPVRYKGVVYTR